MGRQVGGLFIIEFECRNLCNAATKIHTQSIIGEVLWLSSVWRLGCVFVALRPVRGRTRKFAWLEPRALSPLSRRRGAHSTRDLSYGSVGKHDGPVGGHPSGHDTPAPLNLVCLVTDSTQRVAALLGPTRKSTKPTGTALKKVSSR
jgi:hypothetical protein